MRHAAAVTRAELWRRLQGHQFGLADSQVFDVLSAVATDGRRQVATRQGSIVTVYGLNDWRYAICQ